MGAVHSARITLDNGRKDYFALKTLVGAPGPPV